MFKCNVKRDARPVNLLPAPDLTNRFESQKS